MPKNKPRSQLIYPASTLVAVILLCFYAWKNSEEIAPLLSADFRFLGLALCGLIATSGMIALVNYQMLAALGKQVPRMICFWLTVLTNLANQVLPFNSGLGIRVLYLKRHYNLPYSQSGSIVVAFQLLQVAILGLVIVCTTGFLIEDQVLNQRLLIFGLGTTCLAITCLLVAKSLRSWKWSFLARLGQGISEMQRSKANLAWILIYSIAIRLLTAFIFWSVATSLGRDTAFLSCLLLTTIAGFTSLAQFTPNNIGIREAVVGGLSAIAALSTVEAVTISLFVRMLALARSLALCPFALSRLGIYPSELVFVSRESPHPSGSKESNSCH